jgi:predicted small secreted protein
MPLGRSLAALLLLMLLVACNTTAGLGQDISAAGNALTGGANKVMNNNNGGK